MKLTIILLMLTIQVSATAYSQQISLKFTNAPLRDVLQSIRKQSGYNFVISSDELSKANPVSINLKSTSIDEVLQALFSNQPFIWQLEKNIIMIRLKEPEKKMEAGQEQKQQKDLTGLVMDGRGKPLEGVTVILNERITRGTTTDANGRFIFLNAPDEGTILVRMIGRETKEVRYSGGNVITITLREVYADMNEVQIIAYGEVSKKFGTSNQGSIKSEVIGRQPVSNPLLALQGRVPGVFITQSSGVSAGNVNVNIQGRNSIANGSDPFYVIDGIPYAPQFTNISLLGSAISGPGGSAFNFINPADIEEVTFLKDADATAIYGSRAANGAILITTKKGKSGKTKIDVNMQTGWGKITRKADVINTQDYLTLRKEAYINSGLPVPNSTSVPTASDYDLTLWDQNRYTDWQQELVGGTASFTNLQASVSGGNAITQFLIGYGYNRQTTAYPGDLSDVKGNIHLNLSHNSNDEKFRFVISASYLQDKNQLYNTDLMGSVYSLPPNAPKLYKADGSLNWEPFPNNPNKYSFTNPLFFSKMRYTGNVSNLIGNNVISYELIPGLVLKTTLGYNHLQGDETTITPYTSIKPDRSNKTRMAKYLNKFTTSWIIEPQIAYNKQTTFGAFDALLGSTIQQSTNDVLNQQGSGYTSDSQLDNLQAANNISILSVYKSVYKYSAVFARLNYRLMDKYIINLNARRDGSSRFGADNKFHNFYSVGGAWLFGDENPIKNVLPWLSTGKLRLNYGTTGNDQISDYRYLSTLDIYGVDLPYQQTVGLYPTSIANPFLQWEETRKINLGLDLGFLNNRIAISANIYRNRSSNQLIAYALPLMTGFDRLDKNFPATVQNTGFEGQLDIVPVSSKIFKWQLSGNITVPKNKLISFPGLASSTFANTYVIGQPVSVLKKYQFAGVNPTTGLYQFVDNKGGLTSTPNSLTDKIALINYDPIFYGGISNHFQYKDFDLDILFQFVKQNGLTYAIGNLPGYNFNQPSYILNHWKAEGDQTNIQKISLDDDVFDAFQRASESTAVFGDASYMRLKNVSLSYTLPVTLLGKKGLNNARVYLQGQNLLTFTRFKGSDPESQAIGKLPPMKMFTVGVQISL